MATQSFYEMLEIDTVEKAKIVAEAFRQADARGPDVPKTRIFEELEEGRKHIRSRYQ
ncbi:MAG: hypothetical protein LBU30_01060 [Candidatus Methanoplasma sp.]|jgi:hypothetical protein|nr:hypothetical protein [Candidatus Methanoplasma sp.]